MTYSIKEIFYTLQGEGAQSGRPAVFCRFSGCNLWSGREKDRSKAICQFCDTEFVGTDGVNGGKFNTAEMLAKAVKAQWPLETNPRARPYVVCTGGEPLLQLDKELVEAFHDQGLEVAIETNGTCEVPAGVDWVCVSPKAGSELSYTRETNSSWFIPRSVRRRMFSISLLTTTSSCNPWMARTWSPILVRLLNTAWPIHIGV